MKLLFAIKTLKQVRGGAERVFAELVSEMARRGHEVTICTFDSTQGKTLYPIENSVRQIYLGITSDGNRTGIVGFIKCLPGLRRIVLDVRPDIIVGFTHAMYVPLAFATIGVRIPLLASEHIVPEYYRHRKFEFFLLKVSSYLIDKFSVLSSQIGTLYPASVRSKMVVIPNSVKPAESFADTEGEDVNPKIILNVGRLVDFKDQKTLIDAFALIADKYPDWSLRIVGEGELRAKLEKQIADYGLKDRISLPGNSDKIDDEYNGAHIFVVSSLYEGFGLVTAEASSHGLPCIGFSDCSGTNEIIEDSVTGMLVDPTKRVTGLAEAMCLLIDDGDVRVQMGDAGKKKVLAYAPGRICDLWETTFDVMSV